MTTDFPVAVHVLVLASEAERPMTSEAMAVSVGTAASRVRKIAGKLRAAGLVESHQGSPGLSLAQPASAITLLDVYEAVQADDEGGLFSIHKNPNDACLVGRYIRPVLTEAFSQIETETMRALSAVSLADVVADMRARAQADGAL